MLVSGFTDAVWSAAGYKPAQEVSCDSLKASASVLQVTIVSLLENAKESNVIVCLDLSCMVKPQKLWQEELLRNFASQ